MREFRLSETFLEPYHSKEVDWGPLGEVTYLRTYSRKVETVSDDGHKSERNEQWWETVRRVVEGAYSIQKKHCESLKLPWKDGKAQHSAQIMFDKMFNFKFLPAGRGLWAMGTKFVEEKGGACVNNCGFVSTIDIDTRGSFGFCWTMDALMLGVGIGFDVKGANKIVIKNPKAITDKDILRAEAGIAVEGLRYTIPDSREGWVESLRYVLDGFFEGNKIPEMDYSLVRPYGTPIKGFGGVASGPEPLKNLHEAIIKLLTPKIGQRISSTDIVDIMNMIGVCVVAGNVRRCLPEHYEVEMGNGSFKRISQIVVGDNVSFNGSTYIVNNVFDNGEQETVRILAKNGYIESTKEHRWLTKDKDGNVDWKTAEEISINPSYYSLLSPKHI